ncbi:MAG TPA: ribosomal RNA small subunit methyltransferase A [Chloroflexi bacterium]|nr:ribosomal RNA small subunit methyltransferase A [Chloroflexota bacterium]
MADSVNLPPLRISELLRTWGLHPDKRLGQNFLVDEVALRRIVEAAGVESGDAVLEIGPGLGSLTRHLAVRASRVVAVEKDARLLPPLKSVLADYDNVRIVLGDILQIPAPSLMAAEDYLVVANIPYYITSAVFRHLLGSSPRPRRIVLTVQREVAERICAPPGKMSLLALSVQVYGEPRVAARVPAGAFHPVPKVDSAVVRVEMLPQPRIPAAQLPLFFRLAKAGFSQKRKTLLNALSGGMRWPKSVTRACLEAAAVAPAARAQALDWPAWARLTNAAGEILWRAADSDIPA